MEIRKTSVLTPMIQALGKIGTQTAIAKALGTSQSTVSAWLSGKCIPTFDTVADIIDAYPELTHLAINALLKTTPKQGRRASRSYTTRAEESSESGHAA
jgi:predicted transcriptional regulator